MAFEAIDQLLASSPDDAAWELLHENSKASRLERHTVFDLPPSDATIVQAMKKLRSVKPFRDRPKIALPDAPPSTRSFDEVLAGRQSAREFGPGAIDLAELAKVLGMSYGATRSNADNSFPRPFRVIPSGGALYPLEVYVHATRVAELEAGLYHYDPEDSNLDVLSLGDTSAHLARQLFQADFAEDAAAIILISAVFFRSTFKYGDRGYRFALLEAGHLVQNALLAAAAVGLAGTPIGGYLDREVDRYLELDGLSESVIYMLLLGRPAKDAHSTE